ncbi:MAG: hypothetical protein K0B15_04920 [Lentimicrobium sp.]|nr:hypothetical protein [Lentimicrobium sp.]
MKAASIAILKQELSTLPQKELLKLCLRLARYKTENKELLTYLLFEAGDEAEYIRTIKEEIEAWFSEINTSHIYFARKSIRKILRNINKFIRYSGSKQTEAELLIFFCTKLKNSALQYQTVTSLSNMYRNQLLKIGKAISTLHEDLQHDYLLELKEL